MTPWPKQMTQKFRDVHALAEFCFPAGSELACLKCHIQRHATVEEIAGFLTSGFPFCKRCGTKTTLSNPWSKKVEFE